MVRMFIWSILFSFIMLYGVALLMAPKLPNYTLPIHKTLYVDRNMDDEELTHIIQASLEWYDATNGLVVFEMKRMPQAHIDPTDAIFVFNASPDYPNVLLLDTVNNQNTLGFFNDDNLSFIGLVDQRIPDSMFKTVILHELSHALGVPHPVGIEGYNTLMSADIDHAADHITYADLISFCQLYHCDASKLSWRPNEDWQ
jgi:hypothetical protein